MTLELAPRPGRKPSPGDGAGSGRGRRISMRRWYAETGFTPHAGQWRVLKLAHTNRHLVVPCGRRWGKTIVGAKRIEPLSCLLVPDLLHASMRGLNIWIVGPTYTDAEKEFGHLYDGLRRAGVDKYAIRWPKVPRGDNMYLETEWGFQVHGRSAERPNTLVGEGLDGVIMVEAGRHRRSTWSRYIRPTLSDSGGWSLHTGVPEGSRHASLLYELAQRGLSTTADDEQWQTYHAPSWENDVIFPGGRQDPEILDVERDLTDDEFQNQYGAKFVEHAGTVMKDWDDDLHLADFAYSPQLPLYWAFDYGFRNDFVCLWIQVDQFGQVNVIDERRWNETTAEVIGEELASMPLTRRVAALYPDPARPDNSATISSLTDVQIRGGTGGELHERLELIWRLLKPQPDRPDVPYHERVPRLRVDRVRCKKLAWEMSEGYRWPEHRSEVQPDAELPVKRDDHGPEALGRFVRGYFGAHHGVPPAPAQPLNVRSRRPAPSGEAMKRRFPGSLPDSPPYGVGPGPRRLRRR